MNRSTPIYILILLYGIGLVSSGVHQLSETHHTHQSHTECSEQEAQNTCHLATVHFNKQHGCNHTSHLQEDELHCNICDLYAQKTQHLKPKVALQLQFFAAKQCKLLHASSSKIKQRVSLYCSRGPPYAT